MTRPDWYDLTGLWSFRFDDDDRGLDEHWYAGDVPFDREIMLPYPPESKLSQVHDPGDHPVVWYRRTFALPPHGGQRVILHFGAVDHHARVWVNGHLATEHEGGHTPFSVDITHLLKPGDEQMLVVRAADRIGDVGQPRGKQDWRLEPHKVWYHRTTGIWQPVWLEHVPDLHITDIQWTPHLEHAAVTVQVTVNRPPDPGTGLELILTCRGEVLTSQAVPCADEHVETVVAIPAGRHDQDLDGILWSPESPTLIDATVRVRAPGEPPAAPIDEVRSYFGYRSVGVDRGQFLLNGRPYFLRMVLEQGYWPQSHLAAPDAAALHREAALIKELGFNGLRIHQKVEDPRFLHACDQLGLLVWAEMPSAYTFSARSLIRITREWTEVVARDRSHPCVAAWVPLNESWGVRWIASRDDQRSFAAALYHLTRALDPSRPVVANDGWEHGVGDIIGVHDYAPTGAELAERYGDRRAVEATVAGWGPGSARILLAPAELAGRPVMVTEFGGIGFTPHESPDHVMYSRAGDGNDFLRRLRDLLGALDRSPVLAGFCYTQLTDTEQEINGLLTAERRPKVPAAAIRAVVSGHGEPPNIHDHDEPGVPR
ncbi:glycoside hydrolase family 2 protein [Micromonospora sp. LZ34]